MILSWTWLMFVLGMFAVGGAQVTLPCPSQELILPCRCMMRDGEYQIWCSHSDLPTVLGGIRSVGQYIFQPIDELILENNNLPSLPGRAFLPLKVMRLMLRYNQLQRVSNGWLSGLENSLMELYLVEPELRSLPEGSLSHLTALQAITIQTNSMKRLPSFSGLPRLNYIQIESLSLLEMSSRHFRNLPELEKIHVNSSPLLLRLEDSLLQELPRLSLLNISYSGLSWIHPRALSRLPALRELSLIGNKVADAGMVGRSTRDLPNLTILHLDFNVIEQLNAASFVDMPSLRKLSMSHNQIKELSYGAFHRVPLLKVLNLNHNLIRRVHPESFLQHSDSGLEELWLVDNDISHVAELRSLLEALPTLTFLDMSYNNLEVIPFGSLRGHPTLERLNLDYNKLRIVDREAFVAMPTLRELTLKNNSLSEILNNPLWNLPALKGLDLSGNFYRRVEPGLLTNLPSLRRVDLSANEIDYVNELSFLDTPALEYVNLSHNRLVTLHPATFRHLLGLYEIDVSDNRLLQFIPGLPRGTEYLHIQRNRIVNFPLQNSPDLDLPVLKMLDISHNNLKRMEQEALRSLPLLKKLYISNNFLQNFEENALFGLPRLEVLDVQNNQLTYIHPSLLRHMSELRELNLKDNKLNIIGADMFKGNPNLKLLDVSRNQVKEISSTAFENTREIEAINASHNYLIHLPSSMNEMKNLRVLDVTNNRLGGVRPDMFSSLKSLTELRLSQNLLMELTTAAFDSLQYLKLLYLDNNELENINTNTFRSLPALKHIKLNKNELKEIPEFTFNNLPSLEVLELQENFVQKISDNAFYLVPHLLMLNLSHNLIQDIDDAGFQNLKWLEMLDMSFNRLLAVGGTRLDKMEWMVELKMDSNRICEVQGATFNKMPRLRVLSLRNNNMMSFPESAVQKLRGNLAVLDIDGNPLVCGCSLLWMRAWLQESSALGPKCLDGTLLRETRLSREECVSEHRLLEPVAPGCESELLSVTDSADASQIFTPWMSLKNSTTHMNLGNRNNLVPSPEESDYFYDEYVDYPYNDSIPLSGDMKYKNTAATQKPETESPHLTSGDTPTVYAASKTKGKNKDTPKEVTGSPSTSGFTFFGVPLPSLGNLLGSTSRNNGKNNKQLSSETKAVAVSQPMEGKSAIMNEPVKINHKIAERKSAIVNKPIRSSGSRGMYPFSNLQVETGGFVPLLPGSGGFRPIVNPNFKRPMTDFHIEKLNVTILSPTSAVFNTSPTTIPTQTPPYLLNSTIFANMGHPIPAFTPTVALTTAKTDTPPKTKIETQIIVQPTLETMTTEALNKSTSISKTSGNVTIKGLKKDKVTNKANNLKPEELEQIKNISEFLSTTLPTILKASTTSASSKLTSTPKPELETVTNAESFEDIFKEIIENVSLPPVLSSTTTESNAEKIATTATQKTSYLNVTNTFTTVNKKEQLYEKSRNVTAPALLIPGGQQPQYRTAGRPSITKIPSPHVTSNAPLLANSKSEDDITPLPHNSDEETTTTKRYWEKGDKSWYFASYNQTILEPYSGGYVRNGGSGKTLLSFTLSLLIIMSVHSY